MSYILEALKKSELARQQGAAALHYSLLPVVMEEDMAPSRRWPYYVLGAGLALNAAAFYLWPAMSSHVAARNEVPTVSSAAVAQLHPPVVIAKADAVTPAAVVPMPISAPPPVAVEAVVPPPSVKLANPPVIEARVPVPPATPPRIERKAAHKESGRVSAAPAEPDAKAAGERTPKVAVAQDAKSVLAVNAEPAKKPAPAPQTPAALPGDLPPLSVGGFIREDGSSGLVVVNDRLVREGDEVLPGLTVEKIQNESVVFNYKGQRFVR